MFLHKSCSEVWITVSLTDEEKKKAGSHQSQDTKTKAFGLRIDLIYFFPVTEYCLQEVYSLSSVTQGKCDHEHRVGLNTAQGKMQLRAKNAGKLQAFHKG